MSSLCSRNARSQKTLVGRAQWAKRLSWQTQGGGGEVVAMVGRVRSLELLSILLEG
jgi:hypothetical protein